METLTPRSSWFDRAIARVAFPAQRVIADWTTCKLSDWAKNERWLNQLAMEGSRRIPDKADPIYQHFLQREIAYWQKPAYGDTETVYAEDHPDRHPKLRAYWNKLVSGSEDECLTEMLQRMGPFGKAIALGHFDGLEAAMAGGVAHHWTFNSITGRFTVAAPENASIVSEDLNFARLKENEYDLIVCVGILHHIVNLDDLLAEVNRALSPGGRFVVVEYIGEERFYWSKEKREYINRILASLPPKYQRFPFAGLDAIHLGRLSPFEAVSSTRIPAALERHLQCLESRQGYAVMFPTLQFLKARYLSQDTPVIDLLIQADREAGEHGVQPAVLSGVYGKRC